MTELSGWFPVLLNTMFFCYILLKISHRNVAEHSIRIVLQFSKL